MRRHFTLIRLAGFSLGLIFSASALASEESQLVDSINVYRSQAQPCGAQASQELPPLTSDISSGTARQRFWRFAGVARASRLPDGQRASHQPLGPA